LHWTTFSEPLTSLIKSTELIEVVTVIERQHRPPVLNLGETLCRSTTDALGGTVWSYVFGMLVLEFGESFK
jgi:hypothetical protein